MNMNTTFFKSIENRQIESSKEVCSTCFCVDVATAMMGAVRVGIGYHLFSVHSNHGENHNCEHLLIRAQRNALLIISVNTY